MQKVFFITKCCKYLPFTIATVTAANLVQTVCIHVGLQLLVVDFTAVGRFASGEIKAKHLVMATKTFR